MTFDPFSLFSGVSINTRSAQSVFDEDPLGPGESFPMWSITIDEKPDPLNLNKNLVYVVILIIMVYKINYLYDISMICNTTKRSIICQ